MNKLFGYISAACAISAPLLCCKPETTGVRSAMYSPVFYTSLSETMPRAADRLNLTKIVGTRIRGLDGREVRYFEYQCDASQLLHEISQLGFELTDAVSDTTAHQVSYNYMRAVAPPSEQEQNEMPAFWAFSETDNIEVYECIKSPVKHHLIIDRRSNRVLHRVIYS